MARQGWEACFSTQYMAVTNVKFRTTLQRATRSKACLPPSAVSLSLRIRAYGYFLMLQHTVQPLTKAAMSSLSQQTFYGREKKKSKCQFCFFPVFSLLPLTLCLLNDERLMECCSARPEQMPRKQKVTETAPVYWITQVVHRYTASNPHTSNIFSFFSIKLTKKM